MDTIRQLDNGKEETPVRITTTLYELVVALQSAAGPTDDAAVIATVLHLMRSGRLTFLTQAGDGYRTRAPCEN